MAKLILQMDVFNAGFPSNAIGGVTRHQLDNLKIPNGIADILSALYYQVLKHQPEDPIAFMAIYLENQLRRRSRDGQNFVFRMDGELKNS